MSIKSQIVSTVVTLFGSLLTVQYLYTITHQRELLAIIFLLIYIAVQGIQTYITTVRYPARTDGKPANPRRAYLVSACDIVLSIIIVILSALVYDAINALRLKITLYWWDYIVIISLIFATVLAVIQADQLY